MTIIGISIMFICIFFFTKESLTQASVALDSADVSADADLREAYSEQKGTKLKQVYKIQV